MAEMIRDYANVNIRELRVHCIAIHASINKP